MFLFLNESPFKPVKAQVVDEATFPQNGKVYHVSTQIRLKEFIPRKLNSYHSNTVRDKEIIYLTSSIQYASAFSFPWTDKEVSLGSYDNKNFELILLNRNVLRRLDKKQKVSLYTFLFDASKMLPIQGNTTPEFITEQRLEVVEELTFSSPRECLDYSGIEIIERC